jgi:hypothetical protein
MSWLKYRQHAKKKQNIQWQIDFFFKRFVHIFVASNRHLYTPWMFNLKR